MFDSTFGMLLGWARRCSADCPHYSGIVHGWLLRDQYDYNGTSVLEPWQHQYVRNIMRARERGISA